MPLEPVKCSHLGSWLMAGSGEGVGEVQHSAGGEPFSCGSRCSFLGSPSPPSGGLYALLVVTLVLSCGLQSGERASG